MRLKEKVAIVTGGGEGMGKAMVLARAPEGASVAAAARNLANLRKTAEEIVSRGRKATTIETDVTKEADIEQMVGDTTKKLGNYPYGRMAEESEVAEAAVFLPSEESSANTGQTTVSRCGQYIIH